MILLVILSRNESKLNDSIVLKYIFKSNTMLYESDLRQRQSKRKIFLEDSHKSRLEDRSNDFVLMPKKPPSLQPHHSYPTQQPKHKAEDLQATIKQLKSLLKEERQKYDQLFEEYEELIQKNNLIQKEYINLKYEHNKELKNIKKTYKEKVEGEIRKAVDQFTARLNEEALWDTIKLKIQKFIANIERITEIFLQKSKKYPNKELHKTLDLIEMTKSHKMDSILEESKVQKHEIRQIAFEEKIITSPTKDPLKQAELAVNNSMNTKQIIFEDEYYGDLDDYEHLEQRIIQRKNYELMKNCNRNSTDIRRKKIFNKSSPFQ